MKQLPEGWKPSGVDHAVRIHRALVEQGEKMEREVGPKHINVDMEGEPETLQYFTLKLSMFSALVEGAKAVLKTYEEYEGDQIRDVWLCACDFVESQAAAYAPKMIEAGMEVPE